MLVPAGRTPSVVRETPLSEPDEATAGRAASVALDTAVDAVDRIEEGLNATYRVDLADGRSAMLKVATLASNAELLPEPYVQRRLASETPVPVPEVLAVVEPDDEPLEATAFLARYCDGRQVTDALALSATAHERLVSEAGHNLAAMHELRAPDGFGPLAVEDDDLLVASPAESWSARFAALAADAVEGLTGGGFVTDDEGRFADLAPTVDDAFAAFETVGDDRAIAPAVLHGDYRPANLVLAPDDDAIPLTRAVLDVGVPATGDGLLDCALTEGALIDVPLGGNDGAEGLRDAFRSAYAAERGQSRSYLFDARYPYYRLLARCRRLGSFGYWYQFAREDDPDDVADRWRGFVSERLAEV